jgi:subtilisin family serine protease
VRAALHGFALEMTSSSAPALAEEEAVRYVEQDGRMRTAGLAAPSVALRLASAATSGPTGAGATVYVLDTGVRADHGEFAGRASAVWPDASVAPESGDCNGHGTWVAALAAGSTMGVAPGASIKAIKVLGCDGSGAVSTVLAGLDWLARSHAASSVAVLPFSGPPSVSLDEALGKVIAAGVPLVAAAGNPSGRLRRVTGASPLGPDPRRDRRIACRNGCHARSARPHEPGPRVDLFASGDQVTSAWNVDPMSTHAMSGTSAAARSPARPRSSSRHTRRPPPPTSPTGSPERRTSGT